MRPITGVVLVTLTAVAIVGCAPPEPEPDVVKDDVFLRTAETASGMEARFQGVITKDGEGCIALQGDIGEAASLTFPPGYHLSGDEIRDASDAMVVEIGDDVLIGGGSVPVSVDVPGCPGAGSTVHIGTIERASKTGP